MKMMDSIKEAVRYIKKGELDLAKAYVKRAVELIRKKHYLVPSRRSVAKVGGNLLFAHYTSIDAFQSIAEGGLRLYAANSLNDPDEGDYLRAKLSQEYEFLKFFDIKENEKASIPRWSDTAFVCSFVGGDSPKIADNLGHWRAYGKDGLGCSIQLSSFSQKTSRIRLAQVFYGEDGIKRLKRTFKLCLEAAQKRFEKTAGHSEAPSWRWFRECLGGIEYLHKSMDYKDESEYRIVVFPERESEIRYDYKNDPWEPREGPRARKYIEPLKAESFLYSGSRVVIGPRVRDRDDICDHLRKFCHDKKIHGPEFKPSEIRYRKFW